MSGGSEKTTSSCLPDRSAVSSTAAVYGRGVANTFVRWRGSASHSRHCYWHKHCLPKAQGRRSGRNAYSDRSPTFPTRRGWRRSHAVPRRPRIRPRKHPGVRVPGRRLGRTASSENRTSPGRSRYASRSRPGRRFALVCGGLQAAVEAIHTGLVRGLQQVWNRAGPYSAGGRGQTDW